MLERVGTFLADLGYWIGMHRLLGAIAILVAGAALYLVFGRDASFDREAFDELKVGVSATSLEDDLGEADYTDKGKTGMALAWVEDGFEYYVIVRRDKIASLGSLSCEDKRVSAC